MNILVINAGSSSLKYQLYNMKDEQVLAKGVVERIGFDSSIVAHKPIGGQEVKEVSEILDHTVAIQHVASLLASDEHGVIDSLEEIDAVGHRVVHGGESFSESVIVTEDVKAEIRRLFDLAPLHNPAHLKGIVAVEATMPNVPQAVVFDTAFHQTMPEKAYMYAIPRILYRRHQIRRYGFHGTSHYYVSRRAAEFLQKPIDQLKMITCHIGNGISFTAVENGVSVDTSMGMTPLEGVMMGTRSGNIDPALVTYIMGKEDLSVSEVNSMLNKHSGLIGISGLSSDVREIQDAVNEGDEQAQLAYDMYEYRIRKYIGSFAAAMNGLDVLVFTAGVGENSSMLRQKICEQLTYLGVELDHQRNDGGNSERLISSDHSKVDVVVIPTDEERVIARDTYRLVQELTD